MYYESLIVGLIQGAMYGLMALGVNIIFGIMKIVNWAHGSLLMLAMYIVWACFNLLGINPYLAILIAVPIMFLVGVLFQNYVIKPLYIREQADSNPMGLLLCTAGFGIALENLALVFFQSNARSIRLAYSLKYVDIGFGRAVSLIKLIGAGIAVLVTILVWIFMNKTYTGRALRATAQDRDAASLMGINVFKCYNIAFGLGCALCAAAGGVFATFYSITPTSGATIGTKAFIILVLGGLESVFGCFTAGLIIGLVETFGTLIFDAYVADMLCFLVFVLVLFIKPSGLFGKAVQ